MKLKYLRISDSSYLPKKPGVYIFYTTYIAKDPPLYIGKATNLRERVKNHFRQPTYKDKFFIGKVKKIGYIPLMSGIESLILESKLIKKYQPRFNIIFRDDKKYFYVGITKEDWPRIFITHQPRKNSFVGPSKNREGRLQVEYIGPFTDGMALRQSLKILRKIFPYRSCKLLQKRPCLWYQLDRCPGSCLIEKEVKIRKILKKETDLRKKDYKKDVKKLKLILKGGREKLIINLRKEMKRMARLERFEEAARTRDKIESLERIFSHKEILTEIPRTKERKTPIGILLKRSLQLQRIPKRIEGYDISNIKAREMVGSMVVFRPLQVDKSNTNFHEYKYVPDKKQYRRFKIKTVKNQNDLACLREVINRRLFRKEWKLPDLIYIDGGKAQFNVAKKVVEDFGKKIPVISLAKKKNLLYNINLSIPILLDKLPEEVKMTILRLRDESHRFAISYHKKLREKTLLL